MTGSDDASSPASGAGATPHFGRRAERDVDFARDARRSTTKTPPRVPVGIAVPRARLPPFRGCRAVHVSHAAQRQPSASLGTRRATHDGARALVRSATFARASAARRPPTRLSHHPAPRAPRSRAPPLDAPSPRVTAARHATARHATPTQTSTFFPVTPRRRQDRPDVRDRRVPDALRTAPAADAPPAANAPAVDAVDPNAPPAPPPRRARIPASRRPPTTPPPPRHLLGRPEPRRSERDAYPLAASAPLPSS